MSTKVAPFLSVKTKIRTGHLAELYVSRIVSLQDVSKTIVSDRGSLFTLNFGIVCKRLWELVFLSSQLNIFKLMAKRNESTKFWKTCSVLVFFPMGSIGRNACHPPSFRTTIAFEPVSAGHLSRLHTEEGVEPRELV